MPTHPQSLHRYVYTENNPVNRTDPSGRLSGTPPCNLLPSRPDTCSWEDIQRWWESDDGEQARQAAAAAARTPYDVIAGLWGFAGDLATDPRGAINVALYGMLNSPFQIGGDLLAGTVCGNGPRLGRGMGNGGMAYLGTMHGAQRMLDTVIDHSAPARQRLPDEEPLRWRPAKLPYGANSFSADTLVATVNGLRPIRTIRKGDQIFAYIPYTGVTGLFTVTDVLVHLDPAQLHRSRLF